jgi:hypothetical protein
LRNLKERAVRVLAEKDAVRKLHSLPFPATAVAFLAGREEAIRNKKLFSIRLIVKVRGIALHFHRI